MKTRKCFIFTILFIQTLILSAQSQQNALQQFLNTSNLKHASIGFCVKDFSGKQISAHNAANSYMPASVLKLVTTATALELLGPDYQFETRLAIDKNNSNYLLIHGYGDPTLETEFMDNIPDRFLREWVEKIKQNIDTTESVKITIIDDYLGYDGIPHRWICQDMGSYYVTGTYGISIYDNTYRLYLNSERTDTCPVITETIPTMDINFENTLSVSKAGINDSYIFGASFSNQRLLLGQVPAGKKSFIIKGDIPDPGKFLGKLIADELQRNNINVEKVETTFDLYHQHLYTAEKYTFDEEVFYTHFSPTLREIIKDTNVRSNNHFAEHLLHAVGRTKNKDIYSNPLDEGLEKVRQFWKEKDLDTNALFMYDGSGLAPSNAVSADFICNLLIYMQTKSEYKEDYLESFARAGKTGTVKSLLKGSRLEGKVFVKSGTIVNVRCYAGYYIEGNKKYSFAVLVNNYNSPRTDVVKAIEKLLLNTF